MPTSTTEVAYLSKIIYADGFPIQSMMRENPALANTPHKKSFTSAEGYSFPVPFSNAGGTGAASATAYTNARSQKGKKFLVPQVTYYTMIRLNGNVVRNAMKGNAESYFMEQLEQEMNGAIETMGNELNRQIFGSGNGWRARCHASTAPATTFITLANPTDVQFFEIDQVLVLSATPGGAIKAGTPGYSTVVSINEETGVLTMNGTVTTQFTSPAAGDYIFLQSEAANNGAMAINFGLADWNPDVTTGLGTTFCGVTRSEYPSRLAGSRYDGSSDQPQVAFMRAMQKFKTQSGSSTAWQNAEIYIHPSNMSQLRASVEGSRFVEGEKTTDYDVGIQVTSFQGMKFIEDPMIPINYARVVAPGAFERVTCGDQPAWSDDLNGAEFEYTRNGDVYTGSLVHDGNMAARKPNQLAVITLPTFS